MLVKIHDAYRVVVAICDTDLYGRKLEEGKMQLDLSADFFKGEEKTKDEVREIIMDMKKEDATFNIVGEKSVNLALEEGVIKSEGIIKIEGVPVALVLL